MEERTEFLRLELPDLVRFAILVGDDCLHFSFVRSQLRLRLRHLLQLRTAGFDTLREQ